MALPTTLCDREMGKFVETASGEVAIRTNVDGGSVAADGLGEHDMEVVATDSSTWEQIPDTITVTTPVNIIIQNQTGDGSTLLIGAAGSGTIGYELEDGLFASIQLKTPTVAVYIKGKSASVSALIWLQGS